MSYDKELIIHKLERWDRFITNYHLPDWDSIPDLGLYMDQVVVLLVQYLSFIPSIPGGKESFVTSSAINNYVRLKIMPAPVKRKYYRVHIAYLIMILTMKQSISPEGKGCDSPCGRHCKRKDMIEAGNHWDESPSLRESREKTDHKRREYLMAQVSRIV